MLIQTLFKFLASGCREQAANAAMAILFGLNAAAANAQSAQRASVESVASYVNEIGFLRAAPQLSARAYLQMTLSVEPKRANEAIALSAKGAADGVGLARQVLGADRDAQAALSTYERGMQALMAVVSEPADRKRVKEVSDRADKLTLDAQKLVDLALSRVASDATKVVFSAGAQRAISLRLAKLNLMLGLGVPVDANDVAVLQKAFNNNLLDLATSSLSTQRIKAELDLARTQWMFMEKAIAGDSRGAQAQRDVVIASDNVLRTMNTLTNMFEQELIKSVGTSRPSVASSRAS